MSRVMLTWELGRNLGYLSQLLPLATRLKSHGHSVLAVVQDISSAATVLGPAEIPFVQSPGAVGVPRMLGIATGYADLLLTQGWNDPLALWGLVQGWVNLFRLFQPDALVLNYSPTARLAARIAQLPCVLIGTGFTVPPATIPLPAFPGLSVATRELATASEQRVLNHSNTILDTYRSPHLSALRELVTAEEIFLTTFKELDQYPLRGAANYVGPLGNPGQGRCVKWPAKNTRRVFAYLRPEMPGLSAIVEGLVTSGAVVVCYAPGVRQELLDRFSSSPIVFSPDPVQLGPLLDEADACVSYAPAATVATIAILGVPQLLIPYHVEAQLTALRAEEFGAGVLLRGTPTAQAVASALNQVMEVDRFKLRARAFADLYRDFDGEQSADAIVARIEAIAKNRSGSIAENLSQTSSAAYDTAVQVTAPDSGFDSLKV